MLRKQLAYALRNRLLKYRKFMLCKPDVNLIKSADDIVEEKIKIDLNEVHPVGFMMAWGFQLERTVLDDMFVGTVLTKPVRVNELEEVLSWYYMNEITVPIPCVEHSEFFPGCDLTRNIVYEIWVPKLSSSLAERVIKSTITLAIPQNPYVLSYKELIASLKEIIEGSETARIYVLSKFAQPGYLGKFIEEFGSIPDVRVYIATEEPSLPSYFKKKLEEFENVYVVPTRSHRKLLLIIFKDEFGDWSVVGYRGSMNIFYPGVDDYLESVNDLKDLQRLLHGLLRAFIIV